MNPLTATLLKRNGLVAASFVFLLVGLRYLPRGWEVHPLIVIAAFFCGLMWANYPLFKQKRPVLAVAASLSLVPISGYPTLIVSELLGRQLTEWRYAADGLKMVEGCNGGAANLAEGEVHQFEEYQRMANENAITNVTLLTALKKGHALAQEEAQILDNDCGTRGHCESHPWKTNWAAIEPILKSSEETLFQ